mmetsp:Transcript_75676/g.192023  ORF Transcript_75676/g.192023 Transcript_75676/m.192023 type:complete len:208 (+) Transcript_75676:1032-1655(+)
MPLLVHFAAGDSDSRVDVPNSPACKQPCANLRHSREQIWEGCLTASWICRCCRNASQSSQTLRSKIHHASHRILAFISLPCWAVPRWRVWSPSVWTLLFRNSRLRSGRSSRVVQGCAHAAARSAIVSTNTRCTAVGTTCFLRSTAGVWLALARRPWMRARVSRIMMPRNVAITPTTCTRTFRSTCKLSIRNGCLFRRRIASCWLTAS